MRAVEVGTRLDPTAGLSDFGIDEVNEWIRRGGRVVRVEGGGAIFRRHPVDAAQTYFGGFAVRVFIEEQVPAVNPDTEPAATPDPNEGVAAA